MNIAAMRYTEARLNLLRHTQEALDYWPKNVRFDVGVTWITSNSIRLKLGSLMGLVAQQDWAIENGLSLEVASSIDGHGVCQMLRDPTLFPRVNLERQFLHHKLVYRAGATTLYRRAAIAAFFGIGEWDAGRVFELYGDQQTIPQRSNVSHKLETLIRHHGG